MRRIIYYFIAFLLIILFSSNETASAQSRRKRKKVIRKDFVQIKAPAIKNRKAGSKYDGKRRKKRRKSQDDTDADLTETGLSNKKRGDISDSIQLNLNRQLSIVSEDTSTFDEGENSIIEVTEEVKIDSTWIKIAEYYSIWDSRRVNPYRVDRTQFDDTINLTLYDTTKGLTWAAPIKETQVNSRFGHRGYRFHYGTDLELDVGDSIFAAFDGIVRIRSYDGRGYGNYVLVRHYNGLETLYGHMSRINVELGQLVKAGQCLGLGGSTGRSSGPHLHYEVRYQGNPIDPENLYDFPKELLLYREYLLTPEHFHYAMRSARKTHYHRIRPGDTLGAIASKYGVSINALCRLNGMTRRSILRAGARIQIH